MWSWLLRLFGLQGSGLPAATKIAASPPRPVESEDWNGTILSTEEYR